MISENHVVAIAGTVGGTAVGVTLGLPNPIAVAVFALISSVVAWVTSQILSIIKKRLGL